MNERIMNERMNGTAIAPNLNVNLRFPTYLILQLHSPSHSTRCVATRCHASKTPAFSLPSQNKKTLPRLPDEHQERDKDNYNASRCIPVCHASMQTNQLASPIWRNAKKTTPHASLFPLQQKNVSYSGIERETPRLRGSFNNGKNEKYNNTKYRDTHLESTSDTSPNTSPVGTSLAGPAQLILLRHVA